MASKKQIIAGGVPIGGGAPVSIQSMCNTDTTDADATIAQILALQEAGCEIVRVSVYNAIAAKALRTIRDAIAIPLVADIHFDYRLAIQSVESGADKIRINPGNIGGADRVSLLADCARAAGVPIRIGVNGGSLEADILQQHGRPSPEAMVESCLRHVRMLEDVHFNEIAISVKSSRVRDTVEAYRLLAKQVDYPLHIGLTEAGMGEFALVKSAVGLGALLLDGIGDTIRVSLTGDPIQEVHAARTILRAVGLRREGAEIISCPTCARCRVPLEDIVKQVEQRLPKDGKPITVAIMGCAVNGPGEAREADIGIAFGDGNGILFKKGQQYATGDVQKMLHLLLQEVQAMV